MVGSYSRRNRRKKSSAETADLTETAKRLANDRAASSYYGENIHSADPLYMLTTSFTNTFDAVGRQRADKMSGKTTDHAAG